MCAALAVTILAASLATPRADHRVPSVKDVMRRVAGYVAAYGEKASIVVGTERYTQETRRQHRRRAAAPRHRRGLRHRESGARPRLAGVPGRRRSRRRSVADRDDRLVRLLTAPGGRYDEARRLSAESARFNIGRVQRNFNVPTTALFFFTADNLDRFKFTREGGRWPTAAGRSRFAKPQRPTLIRTPGGQVGAVRRAASG